MSEPSDRAPSPSASAQKPTEVEDEKSNEIQPEDNLESKEEPKALAVEHPLESCWVFWYDSRPVQTKRLAGEKDAYESNLRMVGKCGTVESFWRLYNNIDKPSRMELSANLHMFKEGIKPMWEDPGNRRGGKLVLTVKISEKSSLDKYWEDLVLALVGETLDPADEVCGAVVSIRKQVFRIALWHRDATNRPVIKILTSRMKELLAIAPEMRVDYQQHEDSLKTGSSFSHLTRFDGM